MYKEKIYSFFSLTGKILRLFWLSLTLTGTLTLYFGEKRQIYVYLMFFTFLFSIFPPLTKTLENNFQIQTLRISQYYKRKRKSGFQFIFRFSLKRCISGTVLCIIRLKFEFFHWTRPGVYIYGIGKVAYTSWGWWCELFQLLSISLAGCSNSSELEIKGCLSQSFSPTRYSVSKSRAGRLHKS